MCVGEGGREAFLQEAASLDAQMCRVGKTGVGGAGRAGLAAGCGRREPSRRLTLPAFRPCVPRPPWLGEGLTLSRNRAHT